MAQRGLLTEDERQLVFGVPRQEHLIIKHYTLSPDDLDLVLRKRGARNQLGFAVQLCLLRHPGFGLRLNEALPRKMLTFLAGQLQISPHVFEDYSQRPQTRLDHAAALMARLSLRPATQEDWPLMLSVGAEAAWATDSGVEIVQAILDWLRAHRIILPAPKRLERVARAGRALARKRAAEALLAPLTEDQLKAIDALLVNDSTLKRTPLAWLRDIAEAPSSPNITALLERLTYVRSLHISPEVASRVHERRFQQFVREGTVAPAFLLDEYDVRRRWATLVAQIRARPSGWTFQKPIVTGLWSASLEGLGVGPSEAQAPLADGLVANHDASRCQDQLDFPQAEAEAVIQPDGLIDDLRRKAEAAVGIGRRALAQDFATWLEPWPT